MAAASEETMTPVRMRQLSRSTSSWHLRTHIAGSPCVSWNRNSIGRPITPPLASVIFLTSRQVRITWLPRRA